MMDTCFCSKMAKSQWTSFDNKLVITFLKLPCRLTGKSTCTVSQ
jgi:hypothetical protein